jgi:myo-inositol-1(or 4)-monophosphatase
MRILEKAITKAMDLHEGQTRKVDNRTPYVAHPLETAMIVAKYVNFEAVIAAAILHDVVECKKCELADIEREFGAEIAAYVALLTEDKSIADWRVRKKNNLAALVENKLAYFIRAADAVANMRSLVAELKEMGATAWTKFNAPKESKLEYYRTILQETRDILPAEMLEEYVSLIKYLEYSENFEKKFLFFPL